MWDELQALKARTDALELLCKQQAEALQEQATEIKALSEKLSKNEVRRVRRILCKVFSDFSGGAPSPNIRVFPDKQSLTFGVNCGPHHGHGNVDFFIYKDKITYTCYGGQWHYVVHPKEQLEKTLGTPIDQRRINQAAELVFFCTVQHDHLHGMIQYFTHFLTSPQVPTVDEIMAQLDF